LTHIGRSLATAIRSAARNWLKPGAPDEIDPFTREAAVRSSVKKNLKLTAIALASIALIGGAVAADAGVVIHAQESLLRTGGAAPSSGTSVKPYTETIEGNRAKFEIGALQLIVDLVSGKILVVNPKKGAYFEIALPAPEVSIFSQLIMGRILPPTLKYKKTGKHLTLAGYGCDQYTGTGQLKNGAAVSVEACYSTDAPGASDYTAFVKNIASKTPSATGGEIPPGIPLEFEKTLVPTEPPSSGPPNEKLPASQPPAPPPQPVVIKLKTTVTKVVSQSIKPEEFQTGSFKLEKPPRYLGLPVPQSPAANPPQKPPQKPPHP
jgi:hypothetical protein